MRSRDVCLHGSCCWTFWQLLPMILEVCAKLPWWRHWTPTEETHLLNGSGLTFFLADILAIWQLNSRNYLTTGSLYCARVVRILWFSCPVSAVVLKELVHISKTRRTTWSVWLWLQHWATKLWARSRFVFSLVVFWSGMQNSCPWIWSCSWKHGSSRFVVRRFQNRRRRGSNELLTISILWFNFWEILQKRLRVLVKLLCWMWLYELPQDDLVEVAPND